MVTNTHQLIPQPSETPTLTPRPQKFTLPRFNQLSLRTKVTALAVGMGTVPLLVVGLAVDTITNHTLTRKVNESAQASTVSQADKVNRYLFERYGDIQIISRLKVLRNRKVQQVVSQAERNRQLTDYAATYGMYDNIAAFDLNGNVMAQSSTEALENPRNHGYFQATLKTGQPTFSQPEIIPTTGERVVYFAAPIREDETNRVIGVARTRMPVKYVAALLQGLEGDQSNKQYLIDANGKFFISSDQALLGQQVAAKTPELQSLIASQQVGSQTVVSQVDGVKRIASYAPFNPLGKDLPNLGWAMLTSEDTAAALAATRNLRLSLGLGTIAAAGLVTLLAIYIANRAVRPIQEAARAVEQIGQGNLDTRLVVLGEDELAQLGHNINLMAGQLETLLEEQKAEADRIEQARQEARYEADSRADEQRQAKEFLQQRALNLLMEVDPVSKGDLTIRATVTPDEVGTIADSYNAIIRSLRQIVQQVQESSRTVAETAANNEAAVNTLSLEARQQVQSISEALSQIQTMVDSIQGVAERAQQAEQGVKLAAETINAGDAAMNRTVAGISAIRETVAETAKKVKRLGEASQRISKVVNLIGDFAAQTNLLALNAAIEAARAGEEGRGFAVVAEEVRSLAQQSATATAEIEQLVEEIQGQTNEVVMAMESGTEQVVLGTQLVEESRQRLGQITEVSQRINHLVQEISQAAAMQTQTSTRVSQTMQQVAGISNDTSKQSETVAHSFTNLLEVAQRLQVSVAQFKV